MRIIPGYTLTSLWCLWVCAGTVFAKELNEYTLDEVLEGIAAANGGQEAIEEVLNVRMLGSASGADGSYDFVILKRRPNRMRSRLKYDDRVIETGFDGSVTWRRLEYGEFDRVELLNDPDMTLHMKIEADFDGPLVGPAPQGVIRRLAGVERLARVDYFLVEVVASTSRSVHYVDSRTFREKQVVRTSPSNAPDPETVIIRFHDIRRHGGIWIAHRMTKEYPDGRIQEMKIEQVEINPGILDFAFEIPGQRNPVPAN